MDSKLHKMIKNDISKCKYYKNIMEAITRYNIEKLETKAQIAIPFLYKHYIELSKTDIEAIIPKVYALHEFIEKYFSSSKEEKTDEDMQGFNLLAEMICKNFEKLYKKDFENYHYLQQLYQDYSKVKKTPRIDTIIETHHLG